MGEQAGGLLRGGSLVFSRFFYLQEHLWSAAGHIDTRLPPYGSVRWHITSPTVRRIPATSL